jgi:hypothetical protein
MPPQKCVCSVGIGGCKILKVLFEGNPQWYNVHVKFNPNTSTSFGIETCRQMDR